MRLAHTLGRARVPYKAIPTDATTFLDAEESAAVHNLVSRAISTPAGLLDRNSTAILSAARKLDPGRKREPRAPAIAHTTPQPKVPLLPGRGANDP